MGAKARTKQMAAGPLGGAAVVLEGTLALPSTPKAKAGTYWGYTVRIANGLTAVLSDSPYPVCKSANSFSMPGCRCNGHALHDWVLWGYRVSQTQTKGLDHSHCYQGRLTLCMPGEL